MGFKPGKNRDSSHFVFSKMGAVPIFPHAVNVLLIAAAAALVYSNSFHASFHFDDIHSIVENSMIHRFDVREIFTQSSRPVLDVTFALNYHFGKLHVFGYHLVNLLLHIANGVMLYFILFWTLGKNRDTRVPLYAALIFIVHPVQTQAVTYIVSRSSVLATSFYLLAFVFFIKGAGTSGRRSLCHLAGAFSASCLGMGTKQETVTLPLALLLYDYYFISDGDLKSLGSRYKEHLALLSTVSIAIYLSFPELSPRVALNGASSVVMQQGQHVSSFQYFLTQLHVIPYYIKLLLIPTNLTLDYDWPVTRHLDALTIFFFALLTALVALGVWLFKRNRLISFGILWFFLTLSVTSSFLVIEDVIFEHRLYLPSVGFAVIAAVLIGGISGPRTPAFKLDHTKD